MDLCIHIPRGPSWSVIGDIFTFMKFKQGESTSSCNTKILNTARTIYVFAKLNKIRCSAMCNIKYNLPHTKSVQCITARVCFFFLYACIITVFCPRAGLSLQTQAPRLQFCPKTGLPLQTQEPRLQF